MGHLWRHCSKSHLRVNSKMNNLLSSNSDYKELNSTMLYKMVKQSVVDMPSSNYNRKWLSKQNKVNKLGLSKLTQAVCKMLCQQKLDHVCMHGQPRHKIASKCRKIFLFSWTARKKLEQAKCPSSNFNFLAIIKYTIKYVCNWASCQPCLPKQSNENFKKNSSTVCTEEPCIKTFVSIRYWITSRAFSDHIVDCAISWLQKHVQACTIKTCNKELMQDYSNNDWLSKA